MYKPQPQYTNHPLTGELDETQKKLFSFLGGTVLVTFAVLRRGSIGLPAFLTGVVLLIRSLKEEIPLSEMLENKINHPATPRTAVPHETEIHVDRSITINRPVEDLYNFWHDPRNLGQVLRYVDSVEMIGDNHAHWVISLPGSAKAEFDAERTADIANTLISWQSLPSAEIKNTWSVRFTPTADDQGTEVHFTIEITPPDGPVGQAVISMFGEVPAQYFQQYLRELKSIMEADENISDQVSSQD